MESDTPSTGEDSFVIVTAADASDTPSPRSADACADATETDENGTVTVTRVEPFSLDPEAEADEYVPSVPRAAHLFERVFRE